MYCRFTVSRYCRRMVSRLMAFTRETSMPDSSMLEGMRSIPSGWRRMPSPGVIGWSVSTFPIMSERVTGRVSGWWWPKLMESEAWGSASTTSTFFPA